MSKETEDLLRIFALIAVFVCIIGVALSRIRHLEKELETYKNAPADTVTVVKHDTIKIDSPVPVYKYVKEKEYIAIHDTTLLTETDTFVKVIELPREYLVYKDSTYRAVVSGVQPRLDSMEVYQKTITQTITKYVSKPAPILKGYGGFGASKEIGGNDVLGRVVLGAEIKGKVSVQADYQRSFKGKKDYVGGTVILNF